MSKAVEGAAMLAGAVGMGALAFVDPAVLGSPLYDKVFASLLVGGIAMEAGAVADALIQNRGVGITTRQPAAFRQIIYGTQRVGGVIVYESTTGSHLDQYNYVIVLAGHEVNAIVNLFLDGRQVFWKGSGTGNTTRNGINFGGDPDSDDHIGPGGQHYNFGTLVYCEARFGDQDKDDVIGGLTANDPNWAESSAGYPWLGACCYVYLKVEYDTAMFPNAPEIKFTVQGKNNLWDPRTSTYGYTANWALVVADVITDPNFGLNDSTVNEAQLVAAANVCDELVDLANGDQEARYQCHRHYDCGVSPGDALQLMMPAAAGRLSRIGGEWYIWPAYWQGSSASFDASALTGPVQWRSYRSFRELINRVNGTYIAPNSPYNVAGNLYDGNGWYDGTIANQFPFAFQPTNYPQYAQDVLHGYAEDVWLNADSGAVAWSETATYNTGDAVYYGSDATLYQSLIDSNTGNEPDTSSSDWVPWDGVQLPKEVTQQCVLSVAQAQRVAKIMLLRDRQQGGCLLPMTLAAWSALQPLDVMSLSFPALSWSGKQLEVISTKVSVDRGAEDEAPAVRFSAEVQETDESVYEWDPDTEELSIYDVPANPTQLPYVVTAPEDLALTSSSSTAVIGADGVVLPRILASWTAPGDSRVTQIEIQYAAHGTTDWITAGMVNAAVTSFYISGVVAGNEYDVQIASVTAAGTLSSWVSGSVTVAAPNSVQASYSISPQFPLTQPSSTTIDVAAVTATFGPGTASYAARTLTITAPSAATWYYVYIADPTQQGESGSATLTATASTSDAEVGVQGYTYLGAILCLPDGSATQMLAGGWPAPQTVQVGS